MKKTLLGEVAQILTVFCHVELPENSCWTYHFRDSKIITHASGSRCYFVSVCVYVCPWSERKTTWSIDNNLASVWSSSLGILTLRSQGQGSVVIKRATGDVGMQVDMTA